MRPASLDLIDPCEQTTEVAVEDLAEILEPADVSTLEIALPSKADKLVLIGGLLVAFAVGAGFVLLIVQSKSATPRALAIQSFARATPPKQTAPGALVESPPVLSSSAAVESSKTVAHRRHIKAANSSAVDAPATTAATSVESTDGWVDPFVDEAPNEETSSDEWKDPFTDSRATSHDRVSTNQDEEKTGISAK